jgi:signal transduction histidine kinase
MGLQKKHIIFLALLLILAVLVMRRSVDLQSYQIQNSFDARIELFSEIVKNGLKIKMLEGRDGEFQEFLETLLTQDVGAVRIISREGTIAYSSIPSEIGSRIAGNKFFSYSSSRGADRFISERDGRKIYSLVDIIHDEKSCTKCHREKDDIRGFVLIESSPQETVGGGLAISDIALISLVLLAIAVVSFIITSYYYRMPLAEFISSLKRVKEGSIKTRIATKRKAEIGNLAEGINTVISDLEKAKREIDKYHSDELEEMEKMASIGEVATTVAHEIKNPLAGISGALQVLLEDFSENSSRREIAGEVLQEIERLDMAVKDLLAFAKPPEPVLNLIDINDIIAKVKETLTVTARDHNVTISLISDNIAEIMIDPAQIEKALTNIAYNSLQRMEDGGKLTVALYNGGQTGEIEIALSDTGGGIPEEDLKDFFKPKFSTKYAGSGLGLAISRNIIENHKGRINVENQPGVGTTCHVILPLQR